jgi:hypothetical protein
MAEVAKTARIGQVHPNIHVELLSSTWGDTVVQEPTLLRQSSSPIASPEHLSRFMPWCAFFGAMRYMLYHTQKSV